ncbi:MAG: hypothetical protein ACI8UP_002834, partial [Porticoccaceae bacterium]
MGQSVQKPDCGLLSQVKWNNKCFDIAAPIMTGY